MIFSREYGRKVAGLHDRQVGVRAFKGPWRRLPGRKKDLNPANWDFSRALGWPRGISDYATDVWRGFSYEANKLLGTEGLTTKGRQKATAAREKEYQQAAAAALAAQTEAEQGQMSAYAAELQRLRRKRGFQSTMLGGGGGLGAGTPDKGRTLG